MIAKMIILTLCQPHQNSQAEGEKCKKLELCRVEGRGAGCKKGPLGRYSFAMGVAEENAPSAFPISQTLPGSPHVKSYFDIDCIHCLWDSRFVAGPPAANVQRSSPSRSCYQHSLLSDLLAMTACSFSFTSLPVYSYKVYLMVLLMLM